MDEILNIDNSDTKKVGISNETNAITGSLDFVSDNNSDKSKNSPMNSPMNSPLASASEPKLNVTDTMGINILDSVKEETKSIFSSSEDKAPAPSNNDTFVGNKPVDEFKPVHRMSATEIKNEKID